LEAHYIARGADGAMNQNVDDPPTVPPRVAFGAVTANAVVMGTLGAVAPMAWLFMPAMMTVMSQPRPAMLVSLWGLVLIGLSVVVPVIPGHDADPWALGTSIFCLVLLPGMAWVRVRGHARQVAYARRSIPGVTSLTAGNGVRRAALAQSGLASEVAAAVQLPGGAVRVLLGVIAGHVSAPATLRDRLETRFCDLAAHTSPDLAQMATMLTGLVRRLEPEGYVAAALVEIDGDGTARLLSCGGPQALILPLEGEQSADDDLRVARGELGRPPLGLDDDPVGGIELLPDDCRVAVVTNAYALAHYDDYASAAADSLRPVTPERAALLLLRGPTEPSRLFAGLESAPVVGPALVISPRQPGL
jgi:hypothetical protein